MSWALAGLPMSSLLQMLMRSSTMKPRAVLEPPYAHPRSVGCVMTLISALHVAVQARLCLVVVAASYVVIFPFLVWYRCSMKGQLHFKSINLVFSLMLYLG
jgi:hypothetical protein